MRTPRLAFASSLLLVTALLLPEVSGCGGAGGSGSALTGLAGKGGKGGSSNAGSGGGAGKGGSSTAGTNAGGSDAGGSDAGGTDAGGASDGGSDVGGSDAGGSDAGGSDAGGSDAGGTDAGGTDAGGSDAGGSDAGGTDAGGSDAGGSNGGSSQGGNGGTGLIPVCSGDINIDDDGDGVTEADGDCDDCNPDVSPLLPEIVNLGPDGKPLPDESQMDENCDGKVLLPPPPETPPCDQGLSLADSDPLKAAFAIDLCDQAANGYGLIEAKYVRANGAPAAHGPAIGIQSQFGNNVLPQKGSSMLALSTGRARTPGQPDYCGGISCNTYGGGTAPSGFPQDAPDCPGASDINDDIALEVKLKAPPTATGFKFRFKFYTYEYPEWVCTSYNDQFIALVSPPPQGSVNGNISFDSKKNPVSVNIAFFDVCPNCPAGTGELQGTGFETSAGGTSWLETKAPIQGGQEFTVRFAIWDTGDSAWDSTVLIDKFEWISDGSLVDVGTGKP